MYGLILNAVAGLVTLKFGEKVWLQIAERAGVKTSYVSMEPYDEKILLDLLKAGSEVLKVTPETILELVGEYWIDYAMTKGYSKLIDMGGNTIAEFLSNVNSLHSTAQTTHQELKPPTFWVSELGPHSLHFHYKAGNKREGYHPLAIGIIRGIGVYLRYDKVSIDHIEKKKDGADHDVFLVQWGTQKPLPSQKAEVVEDLETSRKSVTRKHGSTKKSIEPQQPEPQYHIKLPPSKFAEAFPFHLAYGKDMKMLQAGKAVRRICPLKDRESFFDRWEVVRPEKEGVNSSLDAILANSDTLFVLRHKATPKIELRGQMMYLNSMEMESSFYSGSEGTDEALIFIGSPAVTSLNQVTTFGLQMSDFALHDPVKDIVMLTASNETTKDDALKMEQYIFHKIEMGRFQATTSSEHHPKKHKEHRCDLQ